VNKANAEIRRAARAAGIALWRIAKEMDRSEITLVKKLRIELPDAEKARIMQIIEVLSKEAD